MDCYFRQYWRDERLSFTGLKKNAHSLSIDSLSLNVKMLEKIWNYHFDPGSNVVDVHIGRLRRKLEEGFATPILHTVRGAGYRLSAG